MVSDHEPANLWEQLVTDGHVRVARVRWMRPWLLTASIAAILAAVFLLLKVQPANEDFQDWAAIRQKMDDIAAPAHSAVNRLAPIQLSSSDSSQLVAASEIPQIINVIVPGLNANDQLPTAKIATDNQSKEDFWRKPWSYKSLVSTSGQGVVLVGGIFNMTPRTPGYENYPPNPARWIGVFRKNGSIWQYATLEGPDLLSVPNHPAVAAQQIPLTLQSVLPEVK